jgi:hypothetical protein
MERESRVRFWSEHIEDWKSSGLSQRAYCAREGIAVSTLQWWCRRVRENGRAETPRFVPVAVRAIADVRDEPIEVVLLSGRRLRLAAPRDETELARLVRLLEVLPC